MKKRKNTIKLQLKEQKNIVWNKNKESLDLFCTCWNCGYQAKSVIRIKELDKRVSYCYRCWMKNGLIAIQK